MPSRPKVAAFDIIGTTFSLEPMRGRLTDLKLPAFALETWFATALRDAFALAAAGNFRPFREVLESALEQVLAQHQLGARPEETANVLDGMKRLPPHPDAEQAFRLLADAGIRILALSNGAASSTEALLKSSGLHRFVERVISVDEVKLSKPRPEVYHYAAQTANVGAGELALIATHPWDIQGAKAAGLMTGYVSRGKPFPSIMAAPDVQGGTLTEVAEGLLAASP